MSQAVNYGLAGTLTFNLLLIVKETEGCRLQNIVAKLPITVGGASQAVDRIAAKGLCVRHQDPNDRRSSLISLTDLGQKLLARAIPVFDEELAAWLTVAGTRENFEQFSLMLAQIATAGARRNAEHLQE